MDLGINGLEGGLVGSDSGFSRPSSCSETKSRLYGSDGFLKERSCSVHEEEWWNSKRAKTVDLSAFKEVERIPWMRSECRVSVDQKQEQMLIFASPKLDSLLAEKSSQNAALAYPHHKSSAFSGSEVYGGGKLNYGVSSCALTGLRGPFTQSQWMELEHQTLIYKYMTSNIPVPSHLLLPIRKALHSAALSCFSGGFLKPIGWGSFQVGFSNNADPEPGRCRRTDGKKWRCSREAVADQKYCERHMNRGRHRSRKPVEGLPGHSVAGNSIATNGAPKLIPFPPILAVVAGGGSSNSLTVTDQSLRTCLSQPSVSSQIHRILSNREKVKAGDKTGGGLGLSMESPSPALKSEAIPFLIEKQQISFEESERSGFGVVYSESLLNPCLKDSQHSLRQFTNPTKNQCNRSAISWPDLEFESEITQLTMSSAFPASEKLSAPPGPDSSRMDLGVGRTWETSIGGPLGEVLHQTNNNGADYWDRSPPYGSSPTGVLQKAMFSSLSNSSGGNSSRADHAET